MPRRTTVERLKHKTQTLEQLAQIVTGIADLQERRNALIAELFKDGTATAQEIGDIASMSPNRVRQIAKSIELVD